MRNLDFSSWNGALTTLLGLVIVSAVAVGIRLLLMQTIQRRRERENRQINERLRTLIAAYKILGGSFTGELSVDPAHLRALRKMTENGSLGMQPIEGTTEIGSTLEAASSERSRRIRDAVEAALSDVILLGTEEQVNLAAHAAREMVAGKKVHLSELIVSLRNFIRNALDLDPISAELHIPDQGPLRPTVSSGKASGGGRGEGADKENGGRLDSEMSMGAGGLGGMAAGPHQAASEINPEEHPTDGWTLRCMVLFWLFVVLVLSPPRRTVLVLVLVIDSITSTSTVSLSTSTICSLLARTSCRTDCV